MSRKKSRNFPAGILLPCSGDFRCIPAGTVPYSLTWDTILKRVLFKIHVYLHLSSTLCSTPNMFLSMYLHMDTSQSTHLSIRTFFSENTQ